MARKTKAEAALTRQKIIHCARELFSQAGVTNTSLEDIALAAKVTRGAVYWHFRNKTDLFMAVRADTGSLLQLNDSQEGSPLKRLENSLLQSITRLTSESATQQTYQMMLWKCEFVGEFSSVRDDLLHAGKNFTQEIAELYRQAQRLGEIDPQSDCTQLARETFCFFVGIIKVSLAESDGQYFENSLTPLIHQHFLNKRWTGKHALTNPAPKSKKKP